MGFWIVKSDPIITIIILAIGKLALPTTVA